MEQVFTAAGRLGTICYPQPKGPQVQAASHYDVPGATPDPLANPPSQIHSLRFRTPQGPGARLSYGACTPYRLAALALARSIL